MGSQTNNNSCFVCLDEIEKEDENLYSRLCDCSMSVHLACLLVLISKSQDLTCSVCKHPFKNIPSTTSSPSPPSNNANIQAQLHNPQLTFTLMHSALGINLRLLADKGWWQLFVHFWTQSSALNELSLAHLHAWDENNEFRRPCPLLVYVARRKIIVWDFVARLLRLNVTSIKNLRGYLNMYSSNNFLPNGTFLYHNTKAFILLPFVAILIHLLVGYIAIAFEDYLTGHIILAMFWFAMLILFDWLDRKTGAKALSLYAQEWLLSKLYRFAIAVHLTLCVRIFTIVSN